jgi:hypothetical protein
MFRQNLKNKTIVLSLIFIIAKQEHAMRAQPIVIHVLVLLFVLIVSMAIIWMMTTTHAISAILTVRYAPNLVLVLLILLTLALI